MKLLWFSCGVTSAVACKMALEKYGSDNCLIFYFDIKSSHPDNDRFINDCEKWYGTNIIRYSGKYLDQFDVIKKTKYVNGAYGARCTVELKRKIRESLEKKYNWSGQVFGFEYSSNEIERSERLPDYLNAEFPLITTFTTKANALGILLNANIDIPLMYKLGYPNNNCIGCVKGGKGYWNKIRIDFPDIFLKMSFLEREVGRSCLKESDGSRLFLDELLPDRGNTLKVIVPDCGFFCGDTSNYI